MCKTVVFVVAGEVASRQLMARALFPSLGLPVISMSGGAAAVACSRWLRPAVVVVAPGAPGCPEWELGGLLRGRPATAQIPLVAVVGPAVDAPQDAEWAEVVFAAEGWSRLLQAVRRALGCLTPDSSVAEPRAGLRASVTGVAVPGTPRRTADR